MTSLLRLTILPLGIDLQDSVLFVELLDRDTLLRVYVQ